VPDLVTLRIDAEEDEDWLLANTLSQFNNLSPKANFMMIKMDSVFDTILDAAQRVADWITTLGFPIDIAMINMIPSEAWRDDVRYAESPIGADAYQPGWDNYDFQKGANTLAGLIILTVLLYFGGKELIRVFKSGALKRYAKSALGIVPGILRYRALDGIDDNLDAIMQENDENSILLRSLAGDDTRRSSGNDIEVLEAIKLLTIALDSNSNSDVQKLLNFLQTKSLVSEENIFSEL